MKVDENYSYDELDGFQAIDLKKNRGDHAELWALFGRKHINLSKAVRDHICTMDYLQVMWNPETKQLLMAAASGPGTNCIRVPNGSIRVSGFACKELADMIERETKRDLGTVRVRLYGTKCKSKRAAVIFDLASMVVVKSQQPKEKK